MPRPTASLPSVDGEERRIRTREGAPGQRHPDGEGELVRPAREALDLVDPEAPGRGRTHDLEDREIAGDAAAVGHLRRRGDVVGDGDDPGLDALVGEQVDRTGELQDVAGVVAEAEEHAGAAVGGPCDRHRLRRRRGGEDVAADRAVGHALADPAGKGRVVAGAAAEDDRDLSRRGLRRPDDAAVDGDDTVGVGPDEAAHHVGGEPLGVVDEVCHRCPSSLARRMRRM